MIQITKTQFIGPIRAITFNREGIDYHLMVCPRKELHGPCQVILCDVILQKTTILDMPMMTEPSYEKLCEIALDRMNEELNTNA